MPTPRLPDPNETWTPETARQILDVCAASGEPLAVCARARRLGVTPARLSWWKTWLAKTMTAPALLSLVQATGIPSLRKRHPNGIAVELAAERSPSLVAAIVAELSKAPS